jgi:hypothetical protein
MNSIFCTSVHFTIINLTPAIDTPSDVLNLKITPFTLALFGTPPMVVVTEYQISSSEEHPQLVS